MPDYDGGEVCMPEWLVRLQGHQFDREELSDHFTSSDLNVRRDEDGYHYLRSSDFNQMTDPNVVRERSLELLEYMNGALKLHSAGSFRSVGVDVVTQIDESGNRHHQHYVIERPQGAVASHCQARSR